MARVVGAVLAAGSGSRMGSPKAELRVDGMRLVERAVAALSDGGCDSALAVVRAGVAVPGAQVVVNPDPERGMRSSLALAVDAADGDALAVLLVDMPGVAAAAVRTVVAGWAPGRVTVATYAGRRAHPIVMSIDLWREALNVAGADEGARALLAARPHLIDEMPVHGDPADLDTPGDLTKWDQARQPRPR
ncbi:MAG: NTP transferase domain-containing protein [Jatrophihabitantaceae bacterium]